MIVWLPEICRQQKSAVVFLRKAGLFCTRSNRQSSSVASFLAVSLGRCKPLGFAPDLLRGVELGGVFEEMGYSAHNALKNRRTICSLLAIKYMRDLHHQTMTTAHAAGHECALLLCYPSSN
jgi:hypothetical protein